MVLGWGCLAGFGALGVCGRRFRFLARCWCWRCVFFSGARRLWALRFFFLARRGRCLRVGFAARFFSGARRVRFACSASAPRFLSGRVCPLLALFFGALCVLRALRVRCLVPRACWLRFCGFAFSFLGWCGGPPAAPWRLRCVSRRFFFALGTGVLFFCSGRAAGAFRFCVGVRRWRSFLVRAVFLRFFGLSFFGRAFSGEIGRAHV